jgi:hypothetical protein
MYLEPVKLRDYIASKVTTPAAKIVGSVELSENGLVFTCQEEENTVFKIPTQAIESISTDRRRYYSSTEVIAYGLLLIVFSIIGSAISVHTVLGYPIILGSLVAFSYLVYQYYQSHSDILVIQTESEVLEFEISSDQKEEAANYIEFAEEI